ncbi:unnamed protein product [Darwinula stevensoni]|uniref:Uncharacterized protein n=1 Tax=Darwinula stevensoni TaxID=69355 RepID=A0A7R9AG16_9CRUS|nr:unnamed protein product [Darwinula stevensoni]CAG0902952.1 unnamed protein product [Darwinula stevensoni]
MRKKFTLTFAKNVKELTKGIFGNVTFQEIFIWSTRLTLDPAALLSSKDRLEDVSIMSSAMDEFPFHILPQLTKLKRLDLTGNLLKRVPALASPKYNTMSGFPPGLVEGMRNLTHFDASGCNLGLILPKGSLTFQGEVLSVVSLKRNEIVNLERGAITVNGLHMTSSRMYLPISYAVLIVIRIQALKKVPVGTLTLHGPVELRVQHPPGNTASTVHGII